MTIDVSRLSKDTKSLIGQWDRFVKKGGMMLLRMYESMRKDGLDPFEARDYIKEITDASQRQLQRALPDEAKHTEKRHKPQLPMTTNVVINKQETSNNKEVEISPSPQVVKEAEYETVEVKASARTITAQDPELLEDEHLMPFREKVEPVVELKPEAESPIAEPIPETISIATHPRPSEVVLDCNKFRSDLRTGLLNSAKLKLQVKDNEVIKIT